MRVKLLIRSAVPADELALRRLAALDDAPIPAAPLLIAEDAGGIIAALSETDGRAITDPFRLAADAVAMLDALARRRQELRSPRTRPLGRALAVGLAALAVVRR
jgi:hypothetical protein